MTDAELVAKKLSRIETCVQEIRTLARVDRIGSDVREDRFVEHTLQIAIQAALDVASHVVSDERLGEPETNHALFDLLAKAGWLPGDLVVVMKRMTGFRNVLVHGYDEVDMAVVRDVVTNHLDDLLRFATAIRTRMPSA